MSTKTEAERQARREADRERAVAAVEALQSSEGWRNWLRTRSKFHNYSFVNQLLIAMQRPDATYVTGFRKWLDLGYAVRRGEHGLRIWMPVPPKRKAIEEWKKTGAEPDEKPRTRFRMGPVFDMLSRDRAGGLSSDAVARLETLDDNGVEAIGVAGEEPRRGGEPGAPIAWPRGGRGRGSRMWSRRRGPTPPDGGTASMPCPLVGDRSRSRRDPDIREHLMPARTLTDAERLP